MPIDWLSFFATSNYYSTIAQKHNTKSSHTMTLLETLKAWLGKALALLDYIVSVLRVQLAFLRPLSPSVASKSWIVINGTCCIVTAVFFLLGWLPHKSTGYIFCETYYIPYNLVICVLWLAEAGLWMLFDEDTAPWHKLGELGLAVFFVGDSIVWLYGRWYLREELPRSEILLYSAIDFFIYLFYLVLAVRQEAKAALAKAEEQRGDSNNGVNAATTTTNADILGNNTATSDQKEAITSYEILK